jgi:hypothetical protein
MSVFIRTDPSQGGGAEPADPTESIHVGTNGGLHSAKLSSDSRIPGASFRGPGWRDASEDKLLAASRPALAGESRDPE